MDQSQQPAQLCVLPVCGWSTNVRLGRPTLGIQFGAIMKRFQLHSLFDFISKETHSQGGSCPCEGSRTGCGGEGKVRSRDPCHHTPGWGTWSPSSLVEYSLNWQAMQRLDEGEREAQQKGGWHEKGGQKQAVMPSDSLLGWAWNLDIHYCILWFDCAKAPSVSVLFLVVCVCSQAIWHVIAFNMRVTQ